MAKNKDFVVFILTHGRPDNVVTFDTLKKQGCTYPVYIIIDNEDKKADRYKEVYKNNVIQFDKEAISKTFDEADNFSDRRSIVYARNACFDIAKRLGYTYFIELDDDYTSFEYRYKSKDGKKLLVDSLKDLDAIFDIHLEYFKNTNFYSIAFAQGGDFIGGVSNSKVEKRPLMRKCMNSFFCSTDRVFNFIGRINEDVNTYTLLGSRGYLFGTVPYVSLVQKQTQSNEGGMTDIYLDGGTYKKSFYTVIFHPSSVTISLMGSSGKRLHHSIKWDNTVPKILDEDVKKTA